MVEHVEKPVAARDWSVELAAALFVAGLFFSAMMMRGAGWIALFFIGCSMLVAVSAAIRAAKNLVKVTWWELIVVLVLDAAVIVVAVMNALS